MSNRNIAIVGSGLVGSLLALYLLKKGYKVTIFDRRPDIRKAEFSGRSINLAMSNRGWNALKQIGIADDIVPLGIPMDGRCLHVVGKESYNQPYGKEGEAIYSISRGVLNRKMIDLVAARGGVLKFNEKIWNIDLSEAKLYSGESAKSPWKEYQFDQIFGCDGAFSMVRHNMQRRSRFDYSQSFLEAGYKELTIPAGEGGTYLLEKNKLHIWPRGKFMLIALPNLDGSFTCTLFLPYEGKHSFENLTTKEALLDFWKMFFPDTLALMPTLVSDFFENPTSALVTIKCFPWAYKDKVVLVGDAAHAIVPFYGHGMNAGFEDVYELDKIIDAFEGDDWGQIFKTFQKQRKPNADAIATLSYNNFLEMSQKTADPTFLLRKKIERKFAEIYPELWKPLYSRVTFSRNSYHEALEIGKRQAQIMDEIMALPDIELRSEDSEIMTHIKTRVEAQRISLGV